MVKEELQPANSKNRRGFVLAIIGLVFALILLAPRPETMTPEAHRLLAVTFLMAALWVTQVVPLAATSLLPLALFPLLGIQSAANVSKAFVSDKVFLYLGGFIIALSIERWKLHRRIALNIVHLVGARPRQLVLGFLIATAGLSMWISNTASTLLMLPIALALLKTMEDEQAKSAAPSDTSAVRSLTVPLLLGIAYSASIGGLTTIVGTPTNAQAVELYEKSCEAAYTAREVGMSSSLATSNDERSTDNLTMTAREVLSPSEIADRYPEISVAKWMIACVPIGLIYICLTYVVLTWGLPRKTKHDAMMREQLRSRLQQLGAMSTAEKRVLFVFLATAALWILRAPLEFGTFKVLPGWSALTDDLFAWMGHSTKSDIRFDRFINDSTVAVTLAIVLFFIPSGTRDSKGQSVPLMNWETATKLPWDIMLLFGGGFALAGAFKPEVTGLATWIGTELEGPLQGQPAWLVIAVVCLLMTFLTEFTSNVATVSTILPSLLIMCGPLDLDPRMMMIPATLATSCAFMLPIATPPNAIVFGSGRIQVRQMVRYGVILNLLGVPLLTAATYFLIKPLMGIQ